MGHWWGTRAQQVPTLANTTQHLSLAILPQLSAVFADGVTGETALFRVIVCHCESGRTPDVSHGEHVICNKQ